MSAWRLLALSAPLTAATVVGCTSILGDFQVGAGGGAGAGDGGTDALASDGAAGDVSNGDAQAGTDSAADADSGPTFKTLSCAEDAFTHRINLGTFIAPDGGNGGSVMDRVYIFKFNVGNQSRARVILPAPDGKAHTFSFNPDDSNPQITETPTQLSSQVLDVQRYDTGIALLVYDYTLNQMVIHKLDDSANDWSVNHPAAPAGEVPQGACRLIATFKIVNAANDDYVVVYGYNTNQCNGAPIIRAGHMMGGNGSFSTWPLPQIQDLVALDYPRDSILLDGPNVHAVFNPSTKTNPAPGVASVVYDAPINTMTNTAGPHEWAVNNPSTDIMIAMSASNSPTAGQANIGTIGGNLSSGPGMWVGQRPLPSVANLNPQNDLAMTPASNVAELPVDKSVFRWDYFTGAAGSENLLAISRHGPGVNFYWWDQAGHVRARHAGTTALFTDLVSGADATFANAPIVLLGDLLFAINVQGANNTYTTQVARVKCQ